MKLIRLTLVAMFVCLIADQITTRSTSPLPSSKAHSFLSSELKKLEYKFSTSIKLRSASTNAISIEDPCNLAVSSQRKLCKTTDPDSCKSCPYTTCEHFEAPFKIGRTIVPANSSPSEGYCVAMKNMSSACNQHHGDWAMIKASSYMDNLNSNAYIRFCLCKRPGFIGNTRLFGSCDHPFICDGDVLDINVPYDDIKCKCLNEFKSASIGEGGKGCVPPTVEERVNWATVPKPLKFATFFIDVHEYFSKLAAGQVQKLDQLIDPCSRCPVTGKVTYGRSAIIEDRSSGQVNVICKPADTNLVQEGNYGIPLKRFISDEKRLLKGTWGPDVMLAVQWKELWVYSSSNTDKRKQDCVYVFEFNEYNKDFYQKLGLSSKYEYAINAGKDALLGLTVLPKSSFTPRVVPNCYRGNDGYWAVSMVYTCDIMSVNLAHNVKKNDIVDLLINRDKDNIVSTFLTRKLQEPGSYAQSTTYWYSVQKIRHAFGVAKAEFSDASYQYLSYNPDIVEDTTLQEMFPFIGMRVKPMSREERNRSNWTPHRSGVRHFLVEFVLAENKSSEVFRPKNLHTADQNYEYK